MFNILFALAAIILAAALLIGIHEFGHFWVARRMGVKVLRFSLGFGKPLWQWQDKQGTQYAVSVFPLGGYVKMLDETEGAVTEGERRLAFNRQPMIKRFAIVTAGPVFNLLLAVLVYWLAFVIGVTSITPIIGVVVPHSIAAKAGLRQGEQIIAVDDHLTADWQKVAMAAIVHLGENNALQLQVLNPVTRVSQTRVLDLMNWKMDELRPDPLESLGIIPYHPVQPAVIHKIVPEQPAALAGIRAGDKVLAINKQPIADWSKLVEIISAHPKQSLQFLVERAGRLLEFTVIPRQHAWFQGRQGYVGIEALPMVWPAALLNERRYSFIGAALPAIQEVSSLALFNVLVMKKIVSGAISIKSLGGPVSLFEGAAVSAQYGIAPYLLFLGLMSIGLAIINLLPIPGLDGGYLLYFLVELITRKPISSTVQIFIARLGIIFLLVFMGQAVLNDVLRLF